MYEGPEHQRIKVFSVLRLMTYNLRAFCHSERKADSFQASRVACEILLLSGREGLSPLHGSCAVVIGPQYRQSPGVFDGNVCKMQSYTLGPSLGTVLTTLV